MKHILLETCSNQRGKCTDQMDPYTTLHQKLDPEHVHPYTTETDKYLFSSSPARGCIAECAMQGTGNLRARLIDISTSKPLDTKFYSITTITPKKQVPLTEEGTVDVDALLEKIIADFSN